MLIMTWPPPGTFSSWYRHHALIPVPKVGSTVRVLRPRELPGLVEVRIPPPVMGRAMGGATPRGCERASAARRRAAVNTASMLPGRNIGGPTTFTPCARWTSLLTMGCNDASGGNGIRPRGDGCGTAIRCGGACGESAPTALARDVGQSCTKRIEAATVTTVQRHTPPILAPPSVQTDFAAPSYWLLQRTKLHPQGADRRARLRSTI